MPTSTPTVPAMATRPPIRPRRSTGTWSGTAATPPAHAALSASCTRLQAMTIDAALSATDSSSSDAAPSTTPPSTHGTRRPRRERVRSLKAPHTGLANSETAAPLNRTTASSASLLMPPGSAAATRSACWASSTWIGPNHPAITPRLSSTSAPTQRAGGLSTGSSKAERAGSVVVTASLWGQPGPRDSQVRTGRAGDRRSRAGSGAFEEEERDLPVGLLLVGGVRRPRGDGVLPPVGALVAVQDPGLVEVRLGAVLQLDLGVGDGSCSTTPGCPARRPWRRPRGRRRRARRASPGSCGGCPTSRRRT